MATVIIPNFNTEKVVDGLNAYQYTVKNTGVHNCRIILDHRDSSLIQVAITQSGSRSAVIASITLPGLPAGSPQTSVILQGATNCVAGDVITFTISSANPEDAGLNTMKARLLVYVGGLN